MSVFLNILNTLLNVQYTLSIEIYGNVQLRCTRTSPIFKLIFLKNEASNEKTLFFLFDLFLCVELPPDRSYHDFRHILRYISYSGFVATRYVRNGAGTIEYWNMRFKSDRSHYSPRYVTIRAVRYNWPVIVAQSRCSKVIFHRRACNFQVSSIPPGAQRPFDRVCYLFVRQTGRLHRIIIEKFNLFTNPGSCRKNVIEFEKSDDCSLQNSLAITCLSFNFLSARLFPLNLRKLPFLF